MMYFILVSEAFFGEDSLPELLKLHETNWMRP